MGINAEKLLDILGKKIKYRQCEMIVHICVLYKYKYKNKNKNKYYMGSGKIK